MTYINPRQTIFELDTIQREENDYLSDNLTLKNEI